MIRADTTGWFAAHGVEILIGIGVAAAIVVVLHLGRGLGRRLCARDRSKAGWAAVIGRAIDKTSNIFIVLLAARLVIGFAHAPEPVAVTIQFLFIVAAVFQAAVWAREIIIGVIEHRTQAGDSSGSALGIIRLLVTIAVFAIALIVVLDNLGVNVTGLVAGLGIGGIAIGLAAQGIFSDLFAALSILFDKPFRRGEVINYDASGGTVEAIGLKSTRIRSVTGEEKIISNAQLLNKEISNMARLQYRRVKFAIGVIYQTDPDLAGRIPAILEEIVEAEGQSFVRSGLVGFGASSLDFELEFDVMSPDYAITYEARHAIGIAILKRFNTEGLQFAYPTQTSFTAAPDGTMVLPYPEVQAVKSVDGPPG